MNKEEYKEYLNSEHWKLVRKQKYSKKNRCCICGETSNLNIHHLTYKNIGSEDLGDLRVMCKRCHELAHKLIPLIKRKDGVSYDNLPSPQSKFALLKNNIKKHLKLNNINCFNKVESKNLTIL